MDDKIILGNVLTLVKGLCGTLFHATIESNECNFQTHLNDYLEMQKKIFTYMKDNGFYQIEEVEKNKLEQAKSKYCCC